MDPRTIVTLVANLLDVVSRLWRSSSDDDHHPAAEALSVATELMYDAARSTPALSLHAFEVECRGFVAMELARQGVNADHPPAWVVVARDAAIYTALSAFVALHPERAGAAATPYAGYELTPSSPPPPLPSSPPLLTTTTTAAAAAPTMSSWWSPRSPTRAPLSQDAGLEVPATLDKTPPPAELAPAVAEVVPDARGWWSRR